MAACVSIIINRKMLSTLHDRCMAVCAGNTHTEDSYVGSKTTRMARKAASYIKRCMGAGPDDALLFCGSGCRRRSGWHARRRCSNITGVLMDTHAIARLPHPHRRRCP